MSGKFAGVLLASVLPLAAGPVKQAVENVTTETYDLAAGATLHIENSTGQLNIAGWDQPQVRITLTRSNWVKDTAAARERGKAQLERDRIAVAQDRGDLLIRTIRRRAAGADIDYRIMVPRDARLVIRHGSGDVVINGVDADIDVRVKTGGILLMLPDSGRYDFNASCISGDIYSDFGGRFRGNPLIRRSFVASEAAPARRVRLHVGIGGIEIQKMVRFDARAGAEGETAGGRPANGN